MVVKVGPISATERGRSPVPFEPQADSLTFVRSQWEYREPSSNRLEMARFELAGTVRYGISMVREKERTLTNLSPNSPVRVQIPLSRWN